MSERTLTSADSLHARLQQDLLLDLEDPALVLVHHLQRLVYDYSEQTDRTGIVTTSVEFKHRHTGPRLTEVKKRLYQQRWVRTRAQHRIPLAQPLRDRRRQA